jgi:hypothetical protein
MRRSILALAAVVIMLTAPAAMAGPTCQDSSGDTIRCGTPGAMPVGWTLPQEERLERQAAAPDADGPSATLLLSLFCFIGGLFALIALMPDFDGRNAEDWDRQEGDDEDRR